MNRTTLDKLWWTGLSTYRSDLEDTLNPAHWHIRSEDNVAATRKEYTEIWGTTSRRLAILHRAAPKMFSSETRFTRKRILSKQKRLRTWLKRVGKPILGEREIDLRLHNNLTTERCLTLRRKTQTKLRQRQKQTASRCITEKEIQAGLREWSNVDVPGQWEGGRQQQTKANYAKSFRSPPQVTRSSRASKATARGKVAYRAVGRAYTGRSFLAEYYTLSISSVIVAKRASQYIALLSRVVVVGGTEDAGSTYRSLVSSKESKRTYHDLVVCMSGEKGGNMRVTQTRPRLRAGAKRQCVILPLAHRRAFYVLPIPHNKVRESALDLLAPFVSPAATPTEFEMLPELDVTARIHLRLSDGHAACGLDRITIFSIGSSIEGV
ncbi:hypothetical protein OE88DRAFT_1648747 [Heliocybe sulcata]|uniref:Uncharacterized protein n=1 Tax=Heliocybe sulcata TaxID=5364 RepID=A0A5C3MMQ8_9AGAM|nr:hypothetical protein OE88DRAFT_1648747 [Heliocybe sulcata]